MDPTLVQNRPRQAVSRCTEAELFSKIRRSSCADITIKARLGTETGGDLSSLPAASSLNVQTSPSGLASGQRRARRSRKCRFREERWGGALQGLQGSLRDSGAGRRGCRCAAQVPDVPPPSVSPSGLASGQRRAKRSRKCRFRKFLKRPPPPSSLQTSPSGPASGQRLARRSQRCRVLSCASTAPWPPHR